MDTQSPALNVKPLQIIALAMMFGMLSFMGVAWRLVEGGMMETTPDLANILLLVIAMLAVGEFGAYFVLRSVMRKRATAGAPPTVANPNPPPGNTQGTYAVITIIGCAMAEGVGLFGTVIYLVTGNKLGLVAAGVALVAILLQWPTEAKARQFLPASVG